MLIGKLIAWIRSTLHLISVLPVENQRLRTENLRLARLAERIQGERDRWVQMHQAAGTAFQASQEIMVQKIAELSLQAGVEPDPMFREIVAEYSKVHGTQRPDPYPERRKAAEPQTPATIPEPSVAEPTEPNRPVVVRSSSVRRRAKRST